MNEDYEGLEAHANHRVTVEHWAESEEGNPECMTVECSDCEESAITISKGDPSLRTLSNLVDEKNKDLKMLRIHVSKLSEMNKDLGEKNLIVLTKCKEAKEIVFKMLGSLCNDCGRDCSECETRHLERVETILESFGEPSMIPNIDVEEARRIRDKWNELYPTANLIVKPDGTQEVTCVPPEIGTLPPEIGTLLRDLLSWADNMGGWVAPVWDRVRAMKEVLDNPPMVKGKLIWGESPLMGELSRMLEKEKFSPLKKPAIVSKAEACLIKVKRYIYQCPVCGTRHDITDHSPGKAWACSCGKLLVVPVDKTRQMKEAEERRKRAVKKKAGKKKKGGPLGYNDPLQELEEDDVRSAFDEMNDGYKNLVKDYDEAEDEELRKDI